MQELQNQSKIIINNRVEAICGECERPLKPLFENNGFDAPEPEHWEIVGYEKCRH